MALPVGSSFDEAADRQYLAGVARDTWHCISSMVHPTTGLPYDNSEKGEFTSVSNIGIYLTSVVAARELKLISPEEARSRLSMTLGSVEKLKSSFGFIQTWNSVLSLQPATHDPWVSLLDTGNFCAGLMAVSEASPELHSRCEKLLSAMEWNRFWDKDQKALIGGYNASTKEFNKKWHLDALGTDAALAQLLAVANRAAAPSFWASLRRDKETKYGLSYLWPGWQGGGLFMQFASGMWLDVRKSEIGQSARNFALAQLRHKEAIGAPVWGWSACDNPDGGYLGWGTLKDSVVTPHACALAIDCFPKECAKNLRGLEDLGVRSEKDGFFDSYDWQNKKRSKLFLIWDQGMLFVSLANNLQKDCVRGYFGKHPLAVRARALIPELAGK